MSAQGATGSIGRLLAPEVLRGVTRDGFWAATPAALARYVMARSRGFVHRSASRLALDLVELWALCQIAAPSLALVAGGLAALNACSNGMAEGLMRSFRGAAREGRYFPRGFLVVFGLFVALGPTAALVATRALDPDALVLIGLRSAVTVVDVLVTAWTARSTLDRRPWLSPWTSWTPLVLGSVAATVGVDVGGRAGVVGLAWTIAALRVGVQLAFLRAAGPGEGRKGEALPTVRDWKRLLATLLPFLPMASLALRTQGSGARLAPLFLVPLLMKLVSRPAQATQLEVRSAWRRFGVEGSARPLRGLALLTVGLALGALAIGSAIATALSGQLDALPWLAWASMLAAGRALLALASPFDGDLRWARLSLTVHGAQAFLLPDRPGLAAATGAVLVVACLRGFSVARLRASTPVATPPEHGPLGFMEQLERGAFAALVRIDLGHPRRSRRSMGALLEALRRDLPEGSGVMAVDPVTAIAGWAGAVPDERDFRFRVLSAAPLDVVRVSPIATDAVRGIASIAPPLPRRASRAWEFCEQTGRWLGNGGFAEGSRVPWLLAARRSAERSLFLRGEPRVEDPRSGAFYVARRHPGQKVAVLELSP